MVIQVEKTVLNTIKFHNGLRALNALYTHYTATGSRIDINFSSDLNQTEIDAVAAYVSGFVNYTTAEQVESYLDNSAKPFVKTLINTFSAENISMGVTQAGKTIHILGLFEKPYIVPGAPIAVSLKGALDTSSLYAALAVLQHVRENPVEYDGLSPFITDARLLKMKNDIETFLGIALSV